MRTLVLFLFLLFTLSGANAQSFKIMTYNIRLNTTSDGVNAWPNRKHKVVALIKKANPDAFGVQEALHDQMQDLASALPDYEFVGVGREDGKEKGEYTAIFYKKNRLKKTSSKSFWLSDTPDVPGSIGWDAAITRMVTFCTFEDLTSQQSFRLFTSHFDHMGKIAQRASAAMLAGYVDGGRIHSTIPTLVCGDFNVEPTEEAYKNFFRGKDPDLFDARPAENTSGTFCGFEKDKMTCRIIDYVFHTKEWKVLNFEVLTENDGAYYPSDHLPVLVTLQLTSK